MNIDKYKGLIQNTYLFNGFSVDEIPKLFENNSYRICQYEKNFIIYLQNEICNTIDILLEGVVHIERIDESGNVLTITTLNPGDIMGGSLAFSKNNEFPMTVISKTKCNILHIDKSLILDLCQNNREVLIKYLEVLSSKTIILTDKIKFISIKNIRDKIIEFLTYEYHIQNSNTIKLNISKKELAERFGIQRPSLFRELKKMKEEGLIDYDHKYIKILDTNILEGK